MKLDVKKILFAGTALVTVAGFGLRASAAPPQIFDASGQVVHSNTGDSGADAASGLPAEAGGDGADSLRPI